MKEKIEITTDLHQSYILKNSEVLDLDFDYLFLNSNTKAKISIKAILFDSADLKFAGNLVIPKGSKGVDTFLDIRCLLIGDKAKAKVIPSLEISENEVRAGHAAAISYLNLEQKSYLMSKGLDEKSAEEILVKAFMKFK